MRDRIDYEKKMYYKYIDAGKAIRRKMKRYQKKIKQKFIKEKSINSIINTIKLVYTYFILFIEKFIYI